MAFIHHRAYKTYDYAFKVIIVGESGTGKTCLAKRWASGYYEDINMPTVGVDWFIRTHRINGIVVKLDVWDTAGMEKYRTLSQNYYTSAKAAILVYDIAKANSVKSLKYYLDDVDHFAGMDTLKIIVGAKSDLNQNRSVSTEDVQKMTNIEDIPIIEVSSKLGTNVEDLFTFLAKELLQRYRHVPPSKTVNLTASNTLSRCPC